MPQIRAKGQMLELLMEASIPGCGVRKSTHSPITENTQDTGACLGPIDIKIVKQHSDGLTSGMILRGLLYTSIYIEFMIDLLTYRRGLNKDFQHDITTATTL